jgi:hypothetical protein
VTGGALPQAVMALLADSGAMKAPHSGRTLFDHLLGTHHLLKAWGNAEAVCLGGLLHSIYGTNVFTRQSLDAGQRATLQGVIGPEAEQLAWLFCGIDRPQAIFEGLTQIGGSASLAQLRAWQKPKEETCDAPVFTATKQQIQALAEIESANLVEQGAWGRSLRDMYCLGLDCPGSLSAGALAALRASLEQHLASSHTSKPEVAA